MGPSYGSSLSSPSSFFLKSVIHLLTFVCVSKKPLRTFSLIWGSSSTKHVSHCSTYSFYQGGTSSTIEEVVFFVVLCSTRTLRPRTVGKRRTAIILVSSAALRARLCLEVLSELSGVLLVGIELTLCLGGSWRARWGSFFRLEVWVGHGCQQSVMARKSVFYGIPSRALNAGSTFPPLATKTALMTLESVVGKASLSVFSFWD